MITGIVCEFNPMHEGHKYLIQQFKEKDDDKVVCIMSGNFVQRGEFAIFDKYKRTYDALKNGADIVIELPSYCSVRSAHDFANAGIKLIENTNICDQIGFACENGDVEEIKNTIKDIANNQDKIKQYMKDGYNYPTSVSKAINSDILNFPNNMLASEYLSISSLPCKVIQRIELENPEYSATKIRNTLSLDKINSLFNCEKAIFYKLFSMSLEELKSIPDVTEGLENRIKRALTISNNLEELLNNIKTKRYTMARIKRIILLAFLGITNNYPKECPYIRVLGVRKESIELLSNLSNMANLPVISKYSDSKQLSDNDRKLFEHEIMLSNIYYLGNKKNLLNETEQTKKLIVF